MLNSLAMEVDAFDDIFLHWQNQFDPLFDVDVEFSDEQISTGEIFLDDYLDTREEITVAAYANSSPVTTIVPSQITEGVNSVPGSIWTSASSALQVISPISESVVLQPSSLDSWGSVTTCVSNGELWPGQPGSCVTLEETSRPAKVRKKLQPSVARVSRKKTKVAHESQKPVKQLHSKERIRLPISPEEHILRERRRRGDMAEKFQLLAKMLPPEARRDKGVIVEDAIKLVKDLKLRREELLKRRAQLKLMLLNQNQHDRSPQHPSCQSKKYPSHEKSPQPVLQVTASSPVVQCQRQPIYTAMPIAAGQPIAGRASIETMTPLRIDASSCWDLLRIHSQVSNDEILVELLFRQYSPHLYSRVMQTVETLKLEVLRGSLQRLLPQGFTQCIITAKSRGECHSRRQDIQSSAMLVVGALQAAFRHV